MGASDIASCCGGGEREGRGREREGGEGGKGRGRDGGNELRLIKKKMREKKKKKMKKLNKINKNKIKKNKKPVAGLDCWMGVGEEMAAEEGMGGSFLFLFLSFFFPKIGMVGCCFF